MKSIKSIIKGNSVYRWWFNSKVQKKRTSALNSWIISGRSLPPPHEYKQSLILNYSTKYALRIFIETGTFLGYMVEVLQFKFESLISIELDPLLYQKAKWKFRKSQNISIIQGDSSVVLPGILAGLNEPALFWLDGHFSGGVTAKGDFNTPIISELKSILGHSIKDHVILIDDARCFVGNDDYPTVEELRALVLTYNPLINFRIEYDVIIIHK